MKILAVVVLLVSAQCIACGDPRNAPPPVPLKGAGCRTLLRQLDEIAVKADRESCVLQERYARSRPMADTPSPPVRTGGRPPPPPPPPYLGNALGPVDLAYCRLIDPKSSVDACLVDEIADPQPRNDPFCPPMQGVITVGDLAFQMLSDRHPGLWEAMLGKHVDYNGYFRLISTQSQRERLQRRVRRYFARMHRAS